MNSKIWQIFLDLSNYDYICIEIKTERIMIYNLTVHYKYDIDDERGYDDEIEADDIESAKEQVKQIEDYNEFNYFVLESENGDEYYNSSEETDFVDCV